MKTENMKKEWKEKRHFPVNSFLAHHWKKIENEMIRNVNDDWNTFKATANRENGFKQLTKKKNLGASAYPIAK